MAKCWLCDGSGTIASLGQADLPVACDICGGSGTIESHLDLLDVGQMPEEEEDGPERHCVCCGKVLPADWDDLCPTCTYTDFGDE